jgi:hypothetical protein
VKQERVFIQMAEGMHVINGRFVQPMNNGGCFEKWNAHISGD